MLNIITLAIILSSSAAAQDNTIIIKAVMPEKVATTPEGIRAKVEREVAKQIRRNHETLKANAIGPVEFEALGKSCCESSGGWWLDKPDRRKLECVLPWPQGMFVYSTLYPDFYASSDTPRWWKEDEKKQLLPKFEKYAQCVGRGYLTYQDGGQGETKHYFYTPLSFLRLETGTKDRGNSAATLQLRQYTWDACP